MSSTPASDSARFLESIGPRLRAYLYYAGARPDDIEDLAQDACLQAHRHREELASHPDPVAWTLLVARNALRNRAKRASREETAKAALRDVRSAPSPLEEAEEAELGGAVREALGALPEDQREAVAGKIWGGLTWSQIGEGLGVSDDTAARLFARGLRALRPKLGRFA